MSFLTAYGIPGISHLIYSFLTVDDDLRLDQVSKDVREINRVDVYPTYTRMDLDELAHYSSSQQAYQSHVDKTLPYTEVITSRFNCYQLLMPSLKKMPRIREIHFAMPLVVNISDYSLGEEMETLWNSVEQLFIDLAGARDHPLTTVAIVPGGIRFMRSSVLGEVTSRIFVQNVDESTHLAYYRRLLFGKTIYIPWVVVSQQLNNVYLPDILTWPSLPPTPSMKWWSWDGPDTLAKMMLDFN